ncbi:MAG: hypothetical protein JSW09_11645 [Pseudomonadota bacterium]|nr:MAG: hypothetical protein JSW09_11645 [Pseudomonadota bacterium]
MAKTVSKTNRSYRARAVLLSVACLAAACAHSDKTPAARAADPHYTEVGFFDMRVCNWPDRPVFFMHVFSTTRYDEIARVTVFYPDGRILTELDLTRHRVLRSPGKPEKRVVMNQQALPENAPGGWYSAHITLKNGTTYLARDRVVVNVMPFASDMGPGSDGSPISMPTELRWQPVPGATHYQVYVHDMWDGEREIFKSKVISVPQVTLPANLLQPGGYYRWRVHARDVHEHPELGDFNHGSLSEWVDLIVAD